MNETPAGGKSPKLSYSGAGFKLTLVGVRSSPTPGKAGNEGDPGGELALLTFNKDVAVSSN